MCENNRVQILCNYGGHFVFKSDRYMYEGGTTRLIMVHQSIKRHDLLLKVKEICTPIVIAIMKYRHPALKSDDDSSLVSIINDEDVFNMMQVFSQSSTPIRLYVEPSNSVSPPFAAPCLRDGLDNGIIQQTETVLHENSEIIASSSEIIDACNKDGNQCMLSHLHEENPRQNLDNGTTQIPPTIFSESNETTISSQIVDVQSVGNHVSSLAGLHEYDNTTLENERSRIIQPQAIDNSSCKDTTKMNCSLYQGQEFRDANAFRMALAEHAIQSHFQYKPIKQDRSHIAVRCIKDGCPWEIHASKVPNGSARIKLLNTNHTCKSTIVDCKNHRQASMNWIANFIIRNRKHLHSAPKDIKEAITLQYQIEVDYYKARRGKELAFKEKRLGHYISDLSSYCDEIEKTNPGSFVTLGFSVDGSVGIFIAYHAAIHGFKQACRPIIILYSRNIKGEYPYVWLYALGLDANNEEFLLAYAVVESLNTETWTWFYVQLAYILRDTPKITIVTKRHEKSLDMVSRIFPKACQWYCRESLYKDFCQTFTCEQLRSLFREMLDAVTVGEFDGLLSSISSTSLDAQEWINEISPSRKHWAVSHFDIEGQDYEGWPSGNVFDIWTDDANATNSSVISSLKLFHSKVMKIFQQRIEKKSSDFFTRYVTPYAKSRLSCRDMFWDLDHVQFISGTPTQFYVALVFDWSTHVVDIEQQKCSCRVWDQQKLPCPHAVTALLHHYGSNDPLEKYCEWYTTAKYREAYSYSIHPVVEDSQPTEDGENEIPRTNKKHKKGSLMLQKN